MIRNERVRTYFKVRAKKPENHDFSDLEIVELKYLLSSFSFSSFLFAELQRLNLTSCLFGALYGFLLSHQPMNTI